MAELVLAACGSADGKSESILNHLILIYFIALCVLTSESSQLSLSSYIILISFDLFTFFFLASLIDATKLGPFGVLHMSLGRALREGTSHTHRKLFLFGPPLPFKL